MNRSEFLFKLRAALSGLPQAEIDERLSFFEEMIDDRVEEGASEEEAVAGIGPVDTVVSQILSEIPLKKIVKERIRPKRPLQAWEIVLIVLGFPLWFPLLIAACAVVLALYVVIWSLIVALWAIEIALWAGAVAGIAGGAAYAVQRNVFSAAVMLGAGILCAGISIYLFFGCVAAPKAILRLTKKVALCVKSRFIGKGKAQ